MISAVRFLFDRIEERSILVQVVEKALSFKDCLTEILDFALAHLDEDIGIVTRKLSIALKVILISLYILLIVHPLVAIVFLCNILSPLTLYITIIMIITKQRFTDNMLLSSLLLLQYCYFLERRYQCLCNVVATNFAQFSLRSGFSY